MSNDPRRRLLELLAQRSFQENPGQPFKLASGALSPYYVDCKMVTLEPEGAYLVGSLLFEKIAQTSARAVGGMTLGADPIAAAVSLISWERKQPLSAFIVRKEPKGHGTNAFLEGDLPEGCPVAVVEDVVTTGGSTIKVLEVLKSAGHPVVTVLALVDRLEGGGEQIQKMGYPFEALFTLDDLKRAR